MAQSKKPPRQPRTGRTAPPRVSRAPRPETGDLGARLIACEAALAKATDEIAALRHHIDLVRVDLDALRGTVMGLPSVRKVPPPLPPEGTPEVILVDERDVTLESIHPKALRRPAGHG
jgi:hypothetical protein